MRASNAKLNGEWGTHVPRGIKRHTAKMRRLQARRDIRERVKDANEKD
jgi:hypothetical protein